MSTETRTQHTPGRLYVNENNLQRLETDFVDDRIDVRTGGRSEADAARIADCWNACEGIDDPAELRQQRDELLKCLVWIGDEIACNHPNDWTDEVIDELERSIKLSIDRCTR